jgi:serine/threonine protein kinase HipA of HipAB toxin-antitoxin module
LLVVGCLWLAAAVVLVPNRKHLAILVATLQVLREALAVLQVEAMLILLVAQVALLRHGVITQEEPPEVIRVAAADLLVGLERHRVEVTQH